LTTSNEASERPEVAGLSAPDLKARLLARRSWIALAVGGALGLLSIVVYAVSGYGHFMLFLWLGALFALGAGFLAWSGSLPRIATADLVAPGVLTLAFAPLYLIGVYRWPVQVGSDEIAIMNTARKYSSEHHVDFFALGDYLGHPKVLFVIFGHLGNLLGGVELGHMRLVHAGFGLLAIAASYALFRQLLSRGWAVFASCILGLNHSFLMLSRMAMRENTVVLVELVALALLLYGLRRDHPFLTFLGGVVAGFGFYVYFPARAIFPVWLLFLGGMALFFRESIPVRRVGRLAAIAAVGLVVTAGPVVVSGLQAPRELQEQQRLALLVFPESREIQRTWVSADTVADGIKKNISYGLTAFNGHQADHAYNYTNPGHGFVDPLTGILIWVGVGVVLVGLIRRRETPWALLPLTGFVALWLALAFLVNKAPNYPRLLITLPFVAYLVTVAVRFGAERWRSVPRASMLIVGTCLAAVAVWNFAIAWDFVSAGRRTGDDIGSTGRYIQAHNKVPAERFYLAASEGQPYYEWGTTGMWQDRMVAFSPDYGRVVGVIDPELLRTFNAPPPFALFMSRQVYTLFGPELTLHYPRARLRNVTADGRRVVLEAPNGSS